MIQTIFSDVVTIGTWTFNDPGSLPAGVTQAGVNILDGWDNGGPIEVVASSRGSRDGDIPADHFPLRSRIINMGGWLYCTSRSAALNALTSLVGDAFPLDTDLTLTREEPDTAKQLTVRVAGPVLVPNETNVTGAHFRWSVTLQAFDPLKYSVATDINATGGIAGAFVGGLVVPVLLPATFVPAEGQGNSLTVVNSGSHDTGPLVTITGPLPTGWRWTNDTTGESLALDLTLGAADSLVLDHKLQQAFLNDSFVSPALIGDWWTVRRGPNVLKLFGDFDPAATVTVTGQSAWR
jgi:Phage tail protein